MRSNWLEGMRFVKTQAAFDLEGSALPQQGPFPVSDEWGVKVACSMVLCSLDPGKNSKNVQFNTVRNMGAFFSMMQGLRSSVEMVREQGSLTHLRIHCGLKDSPVGCTEEWEISGYLTKLSVCLLYTSPSPRDVEESRMPSSA